MNEGSLVQSSRRGAACGKAILVGEHFVVHGAPAIAVPLRGRGVTVTLVEPHLARELDPVLHEAVTKMLAALGAGPVGVEVSVTLPIASGLGSSAALAVALVRALGETDPARVQAQAHMLERIAHGNPSGIDDAVVSRERALWFQRDATPPIEMLDVAVPPLWVATVSRTIGTREAVAGVARWRSEHPEAFDGMLAGMGTLVEETRRALEAHDDVQLGALMDRAQVLLDEVGVVDPRHRSIVAAARRAGALGAKTTGAGHGGAVLVLAPREPDLGPILLAAGAEHVFFAEPSR